MAGIPAVGLILLIVGLRQRSRSRQQQPGCPPPGPYPYGPPPPPGISVGSYYPQSPGPPAPPTPAQFYPTGDPPPHPARSGTALIVAGSLVLAFGMLGILGQATNGVSQHRSSTHSPNIGQCISQSDFEHKNLGPAPQDCQNLDAIFEVASTGGASANCPDGKFEDSTYTVLGNASTRLCLMLNFKQGECYSASGDSRFPTFTPAGCNGSGFTFKVVERADGNSDTESCPEGTKGVAYPSPARLYCLQPLKN
jgi:hypothetical protein